ncbi:hypothetical protein B1F79_01830, partial [Coxiella-like endosymbiont of Rhipicephalus sanguineus]|uniref:hypothetical protein n=1 Tax=Coxiella-like endosymbiont of Rhipicephalus sanguineus TaxID=1955402 RepID=UPI00255AC55A
WEGDDPSQSRNLTYHELYEEVRCFANGLERSREIRCFEGRPCLYLHTHDTGSSGGNVGLHAYLSTFGRVCEIFSRDLKEED